MTKSQTVLFNNCCCCSAAAVVFGSGAVIDVGIFSRLSSTLYDFMSLTHKETNISPRADSLEVIVYERLTVSANSKKRAQTHTTTG